MVDRLRRGETPRKSVAEGSSLYYNFSGRRVACGTSESAAGMLLLQLCSIDDDDFSLIRPFVRRFDKASADRIVTNVVPLLSVTLVASQHMIEESRLPKSR